MSDNILNGNEFFSDKDIPDCVKVGVTSLALGGTYDPNAKNMKGSKIFSSVLFRKGETPTPVIHEYTRGCLESNATQALLRGMGCNKIFGENLTVLFDGSMSDKEICEKLAEASQSYYNMSVDGRKGSYQNSRDAIVDTLKIAHEVDPSNITSQKTDALLDCLDAAFSQESAGKKKSLTT